MAGSVEFLFHRSHQLPDELQTGWRWFWTSVSVVIKNACEGARCSNCGGLRKKLLKGPPLQHCWGDGGFLLLIARGLFG